MTISSPNPAYRYFSPGVIIAYVLAHFGLLFLGNHPFWDDWVLVDASSDQILDTFRQAGSFFNIGGYLHVGMLAVGPWLYRLLTFIIYYGTGFCFYAILRRTALLSERQAFVASILFLVLPFNLGRNALILFPYTLCLFLFMLAWLVFPRKRVLGLILFFVSFNINSLLVFYLLPLIEDFCEFARKTCSVPPLTSALFLIRLSQYLFSRPITVALPLVYYMPKTLLYRPYGFYSGYNEQFSVLNLLTTPARHLNSWTQSIARGDYASICVLILVFFMLFMLGRAVKLRLNNYKALAVSLLTLLLGLFPYYILGHVPSFDSWSSRHQLLMPFGFSMLLAIGIGAIPSKSLARAITAFAISMCVIVSGFTSALFLADAWKQQAIQQFMAKTLDFSKPGLLILYDNTPNALGRSYAFYELNGMLARAAKSQSFFGINPAEIALYESGQYDKYFSPYYNAASHHRSSEGGAVAIVIDSLSPMLTIFPHHLRACLVDISSSAVSLPSALSSPNCPSKNLARLQ